MSSRLACIVAPLFPLAARLRSEPELFDQALAIFEGNAHNARVVAATRLARQAGIHAGLSLPQARALLPGLLARGRDDECERTAQEILLEIAETFSPRVENAGDGVAYLDIQGLLRHFNSDSPETELGRSLGHALDRAGLPTRIGIASSKLAARVAAGLPHTPTIVEDGEEADFLAPLPLDRLSPDGAAIEKLRNWGIQSIGEFARIPVADISSRLGQAGSDLHSSARGLDPHPLIPHQPPPCFGEALSLEWPLLTLEPFLFLARSALERLCRRLETQGLGCLKLDLVLRLEPDGRHERSITLPSPTCDVKTLLTLVRLDLEAHPPGAPVIGFGFDAHPDRPRAAQLSLLGPAVLSPEKLATTLARLFAVVGAGRIGTPRTVDGHRPERFEMSDYAPPPPPKLRHQPPTARGLLAVRTLRPPIRLEAETREVSEEAQQPLSLRPFDPDLDDTKLRGAIRVASGPWLLEEGWWTDNAVYRDYWDVELETGELLRIYQERCSRHWFVDGVYD